MTAEKTPTSLQKVQPQASRANVLPRVKSFRQILQMSFEAADCSVLCEPAGTKLPAARLYLELVARERRLEQREQTRLRLRGRFSRVRVLRPTVVSHLRRAPGPRLSQLPPPGAPSRLALLSARVSAKGPPSASSDDSVRRRGMRTSFNLLEGREDKLLHVAILEKLLY